MTTFHWVRHGPTHDPNFVGWRDVAADLSDGDQIARLHRFLPADAVVTSSDLRRASDTADAIAHDRPRVPPLPGLREFHFGSWDGRPGDAIRRDQPDLSRAYWQNPGDTAPPGGESWHMAAARVSTAADHLARAHAGRDIIVVAHIGAILTQLQRALACSAREVLEHRIDNLSVTSIDLTSIDLTPIEQTSLDRATPDLAAQGARVLCINHLP